MKNTKNTLALASLASLALSAASLQAAVVFTDDFETPDVTAADSDGNTSGAIDTSKWVQASNGFGSGRQGTVDEAHGDFTDPVGEQAYAFRYTNSGITTAAGVFGNLGDFVGQTLTVTFDVVLDGHNGGQPFHAGLVTFAAGGTRNDITGGMGTGTSAVLAELNDAGDGTGPTGVTVDATYQTVSFSYTPDGTEGTLNDDLALRFDGATTTAIIDNVSVVPEPSIAILGGLGLFGLLRRRR
jgi:hypothetical protein